MKCTIEHFILPLTLILGTAEKLKGSTLNANCDKTTNITSPKLF